MKLSKLVILLITAVYMFNVHADTLVDLKKCAENKDSLERLECYDNVVKWLDSHVSSKPTDSLRVTEPKDHTTPVAIRPSQAKPVVVQQPQKQKQVDDFGGEHLKKDKESIEEVFFTVKSVKRVRQNKLVVTFKNGQVWYQTDDNFLKVLPGDRVKLSKGMLGVIYLKTENQNRRIKVKRRK
ncbi:hypothetical protein Q4493_13285 [Colwellia sp. 1_MG-2023]|uniref:hypothetical protein n=1 Tax=Colwellia sp. 1_MG-2023 TaxID=3062649 RepID=UPI0026E465B2|nr:hypothetical protein [Colwellia sp. 1_MG-2023]MDO6446751.1 hypothetical protein [Colwellia sp. 1_MG-2023]